MKSGIRILLCCFCALFMSASSCEERMDTESKEEVAELENGTRAMVTTQFLDEGCEVLLEIQENGKKVLLLPIEIEDQYKIDGLQLLITFHFSRIMQSSCQIGRPIVIDTVDLVD